MMPRLSSFAVVVAAGAAGAAGPRRGGHKTVDVLKQEELDRIQTLGPHGAVPPHCPALLHV